MTQGVRPGRVSLRTGHRAARKKVAGGSGIGHQFDPDENAQEKRARREQERWRDVERLIAELDKCELRCVSCHDLIHEAQHGSSQRYLIWGCRCEVCVEAMRKRSRDNHARARDRQGKLPRVPAQHGTKVKIQ